MCYFPTHYKWSSSEKLCENTLKLIILKKIHGIILISLSKMSPLDKMGKKIRTNRKLRQILRHGTLVVSTGALRV